MRFYLVTFTHADKRTYRSMTSAALAMDAIRDMARQGWTTARIQRGTTDIDRDELEQDVKREKAELP